MVMLPGALRDCSVAVLLLACACTGAKPHPEKSAPASLSFPERGVPPVVGTASVVAFWLAAVDTVAEADRSAAREAFRHSNAMLGKYLADTDIVLVATVNDTVIIQLAGGTRRVVMLSGLDFPYGYVLIEPGYAEEFHTGVTSDEDLRDAVDDYFGLESDNPGPRHRIAHRPGPRITLVRR